MNKIYYFTGSGNSLVIARKIADKMSECELIHVTSKLDSNISIEAESLGFVFPVYAWGMPVLFKEFLQKLNIKKAEYIFMITNYAGSAGNALGAAEKLIRKQGKKVNAFGEIVMPSNYVAMGDASSQDKATKILQKAEPVIDELAEKISRRETILKNKVSISGKLLSAIVYPLFSANIRRTDKSFFFTKECNGCGICAKICPAENIILNENKQPVWQHRCEQCHACIHWCAQRAIEFNAKTVEKNRYSHPDVKASELF